jgi:hypothetical protein
MPELRRRPLRRRGGAATDDFTSEEDVRAAVAALRAAHATLAEAEASEEWRGLSRRVARWVLRTWRGLPVVAPEEAAVKIARAYLRRPEFLPELPPANRSEREDQS